MSPTYKLLIGVPGKSNAFEISKKLGLDESIILKAQSLLNSEDIKFETILKNIYDDKIQIENEKLEISNELKKVSKLRLELEKEHNEENSKATELINNAKIEARNILLKAKDEASSIIKDMNNAKSPKELNNLRNSLNDKIKNTAIIMPNVNNSKIQSLDKKDIKPNLKVFVTTLNKDGIVLSNVSKSDEVQVQIGSMKMNVNIKYLEKSQNVDNNKSNYTYNSISKSRTINSEINVIGETVDDAILIVDKFLDDCSLARLQNVRIIHGKGTGKLKNGIHKFLKSNPHVKSFRMGTFGEGEMGVTVVELK